MDNELTVEATVENISAVTDFVNEKLEAAGASMKAVMQVDIAVDELFGNIAHYAYGGKTGPATVRVDIVREPEPTAIIAFKDQGKPYNPLAKEDPDTTLSADEREIGGLGIFIVKQSMDGMDYDYVDGSNVLAIKKVLS